MMNRRSWFGVIGSLLAAVSGMRSAKLKAFVLNPEHEIAINQRHPLASFVISRKSDSPCQRRLYRVIHDDFYEGHLRLKTYQAFNYREFKIVESILSETPEECISAGAMIRDVESPFRWFVANIRTCETLFGEKVPDNVIDHDGACVRTIGKKLVVKFVVPDNIVLEMHSPIELYVDDLSYPKEREEGIEDGFRVVVPEGAVTVYRISETKAG